MRCQPSTTERLQAWGAGLAAAAVACRLAFHAIGSHVDANGVLREPFGLLPISSVLLLSSGAAFTGAWISRRRRR